MIPLIVGLCVAAICLGLVYLIGDWQLKQDYNDLMALNELTKQHIDKLITILGPETVADLLTGAAEIEIKEIDEEQENE